MGWLLTEPDRPYKDASKTNVQDTWRKFGWVPPSELKQQSTDDKITALPLMSQEVRK